MYLELGSQTLNLTPESGFNVTSFNIGYPVVRTNVDDRPSGDGVDDRSSFHGARAVTLEMRVTGDKWERIDQLSRFLNPATRPYLYFDDGAQPRRIRLRPADRQLSIIGPSSYQDLIVQWSAPDGIVETVQEFDVQAFAGLPLEPGFTFDLTFDTVFPESTVIGTTTVNNIGSVNAYPIIRLWGPCVNPRIENVSDPLPTGVAKRLTFGITLGVGEFLEVDTRERTVLLDGLASRNRYQTIDFTTSTWFALRPGSNFVRFFPVAFSGNSRAQFLYRAAFL